MWYLTCLIAHSILSYTHSCILVHLDISCDVCQNFCHRSSDGYRTSDDSQLPVVRHHLAVRLPVQKSCTAQITPQVSDDRGSPAVRRLARPPVHGSPTMVGHPMIVRVTYIFSGRAERCPYPLFSHIRSFEAATSPPGGPRRRL